MQLHPSACEVWIRNYRTNEARFHYLNLLVEEGLRNIGRPLYSVDRCLQHVLSIREKRADRGPMRPLQSKNGKDDLFARRFREQPAGRGALCGSAARAGDQQS